MMMFMVVDFRRRLAQRNPERFLSGKNGYGSKRGWNHTLLREVFHPIICVPLVSKFQERNPHRKGFFPAESPMGDSIRSHIRD